MKNSIQRGTNPNHLPPTTGGNKRAGHKIKSHMTHPYLTDNFIQDPNNHFWNSAKYSEAQQRYFIKVFSTPVNPNK